MQNPWLKLDRSGPPYVLEIDRDHVNEHNGRSRPEQRLRVDDALPEPFIGNPETAKVVLLNLNPGFGDEVPQHHGNREIKEAIFRNLHREYSDHPFYAFAPAFKETGVEKYWRKYTKELQKEAGLNDREFAQRLLVIEWFPYASKRFKCFKSKFVCESQKYSLWLAKEMLAKKGVQMVVMRARNKWAEADSGFTGLPFLKNRRNPWITRRNMEASAYDQLIGVLRDGL